MSANTWYLLMTLLLVVIAALLVVLNFQFHRFLGGRKISKTSSQDVAAAGDTTALNLSSGAIITQLPPKPLLAFVANPSKANVKELKGVIFSRCEAEELPTPLWFETTVADSGYSQTKEALAQGATIVIAVGGDGTVRAVARSLVGTQIPMGLLPLGTGNLLARNLDIPISELDEAFELILNGPHRKIDVGWLELQNSKDKHIFLVIAGLGFDAAMIADADDALKKRMGWMAYFLSGLKHLHGKRLRLHIRLDDSQRVSAQARTILIGNCGRLPGGITLIPEAQIDDGTLDVAVIDTRASVVGWAQLFGEVVLQGFGVSNNYPRKIGRINHAQAKRVLIETDDLRQVQVDGDVLGETKAIRTWVEPGALIIKAPKPKLNAVTSK